MKGRLRERAWGGIRRVYLMADRRAKRGKGRWCFGFVARTFLSALIPRQTQMSGRTRSVRPTLKAPSCTFITSGKPHGSRHTPCADRPHTECAAYVESTIMYIHHVRKAPW